MKGSKETRKGVSIMMEVHVQVATVEKQTEKAVLVGLENGLKLDHMWLPKSQVKLMCQRNKDGQVYNIKAIMPYWLAKNNGIFAKTHSGHDVYGYTVFNE